MNIYKFIKNNTLLRLVDRESEYIKEHLLKFGKYQQSYLHWYEQELELC